jgi:Subtilase family/Carboxypeptidase regulatory-like domain
LTTRSVTKGLRCLGSVLLLAMLLAGYSTAQAQSHHELLRARSSFQPLPDVLVANQTGAISQAVKLGGTVKHHYEHFTVVSYRSIEAANKAVAALSPRYTAELDGQLPIPGPRRPQSQLAQIRSFGGEEIQPFLVHRKTIFAPDRADLGEGIVVAVIDTGIDATHPALRQNVLPGGWDFGMNDADPSDVEGHGTHVAGDILSVAPSAKLLSLKVANAIGSLTESGVIAAIDFAASKHVHVINLSLGRLEGGHPSPLWEQAVQRAIQAGIAVVAAAGNEADDFTRQIPVRYSGVVKVMAGDCSRVRAGFSNYGAGPGVIMAPGVKVLSTASRFGWAIGSGTSDASPIVAGAMAAVWSQYPSWTQEEVLTRLISTADQGIVWRNEFAPYLNLGRALGQTIQGVSGYCLDGMAPAPQGTNIGQVTLQTRLRDGSSHEVTTDASGCFFLPLPPGTYPVTWKKDGYIPVERDLTVGEGVTTSMPPIPLIPIRNQGETAGDISVVVVNTSLQADGSSEAGHQPFGASFAAGLLTDSRQSIGAGVNSFAFLRLANPGDYWASPYLALARSARVDECPITSFVLRPEAGPRTLVIDNAYEQRTKRDPDTGESLYHAQSRPFGESEIVIYIAQRDQLLATLTPPQAPEGYHYRWTVCQITPSTAVMSPINKLGVSPDAPHDGG